MCVRLPDGVYVACGKLTTRHTRDYALSPMFLAIGEAHREDRSHKREQNGSANVDRRKSPSVAKRCVFSAARFPCPPLSPVI